uniref:Uncharacterized protein n=1 Tax=Acrobeloides nanus TaxID=290746 RepID=A0A914EDS0_9BILA
MCCYFIAPHRVKPDLRSFGLKNKKQQPESLQQPVQKTNQVNPAEIYSPMKNCSSPAPLPRTPEPYLFPFHYRDNRFDFDADKIYADAVKRKLTPSKML